MTTVEEDLAAKAAAEREAAESAARKAAHDEAAAKIADEKAAAEFEEWKQAAANRRRTMELATQASEFDNMTKLQTAVQTATPDLKGLKRGETTAPDSVLYSTLLTTRALADAAAKVAKAVKSTGKDAYRVFLTSDADLLSRDAQLRTLDSRLITLTAFIRQFPPPGPAPESGVVLGVATAAAKLIPGLLELFAANRKLTASAITVEDHQAVTAVAGALAAGEGQDFLIIDDARFLKGGSVVQQHRDELEEATIRLQMEVAEEKSKTSAEQDAPWLAEAAAVVKTGQDALAALDTIPAGAKHSPLTAAIAMEQIRDSDLDFILIVRSAGGSATQLISDRPLAMKDPIYLAGTVALSYTLLERSTSQVVAAGVVPGSAELKGVLGSRIDLQGLR
jgi:hypothetical protein